jgi:prepilin-type processing-associated H-X9-DG protein/prepilin-type N-terminal cleavage/methylation domain-containing protein
MPSLHHSSKRGFTLTELTVVVLIVFVLGMILYPVFGRPRRSHIHGSPQSNQKQVALGFLQYIQDYDEQFPPGIGYTKEIAYVNGKPNLAQPAWQSWGPDRALPDGRIIPGLLSPYMRSNALFLDELSHRNQNPQHPRLEYMYNDLLVGIKQGNITGLNVTVLSVGAENRLENVGHAHTPSTQGHKATFNIRGGCDAEHGASIGEARVRHQGGANFAFTDGHLKWFKGGADDRVFFPPRESASIGAVDARTKQQIGPKPGTDMVFQGRQYDATFHVK